MAKGNQLYICVDFDGTCITHDYPKIGKEVGAAKILRALVAKGHMLILFTMRSGKSLEDAVDWFKLNEIELFGIQRNPTQVWTTSPKAYGHLYIDDAALGAPLKFDATLSNRPYIDWTEVESLLTQMCLL